MKSRNNIFTIFIFSVFIILSSNVCRGEEISPAEHEYLLNAEESENQQSVTYHHQFLNSEHPPINCPLRKQGIDPNHLKPFEDIDKYIAFLEREDRDQWQKPEKIIEILALSGSETVADLGAGSGYFTFRFSKALPRGKAIAMDIEPEMIRHIYHRSMVEGISNIEVKIISPDDPEVPSETDLVFICDVLHHVQNKEVWLSKLFSHMKSGARLVIIEFKEGNLPEGPPESIKISKKEMVNLVTGAGFVIQKDLPELLPYQTFLLFSKS
ncbi:MAG: class I SAM-dependent methyltransferase [Candidatus Omnitrophica bacterium]|nr:class I SAM-dependent methyltransferase [Candidatus Omnitrophota bacterium]